MAGSELGLLLAVRSSADPVPISASLVSVECGRGGVEGESYPVCEDSGLQSVVVAFDLATLCDEHWAPTTRVRKTQLLEGLHR